MLKPVYRYPVDMKSSLSLNIGYEPIEAHIILWGIEQSLMPREIGKRWEWEVTLASKDILATLFQDYDWADEVLHAQIGRKWLMPEFGTRSALLKAWDTLMERWGHSLATFQIHSQQQEWWPDFLADMRRQQAMTPETIQK